MREHKSAMLFTKYRLMAILPEAKIPTKTAKLSIIIQLITILKVSPMLTAVAGDLV